MGGLCSKEVDNSPSNRPVHTLGSSGPRTAPVPSRKPQKIGGPPRILGGSAAGGSATANAARAAAQRAEANKPKGALGKALDEQRRRTDNEVLKQASEEERRRREVESQARAREYN